MKINFENRKIADNCTFIAYCLIIVISFLGILAIADGLFRWDILSPGIEKVAYLIMFSSVIIIFSAFLISLMVNMNIMSQSMEDISKHLNQKEDGTDD